MTVVLSSHLIGDLRATCDHLVVLAGGQVRLDSGMDDVVAAHQRLVGPAQLLDTLAPIHEVVQVRRTDRQAEVLVRTHSPLFDHRWQSHPVDLEQIVVAYLSGNSGRCGSVAQVLAETPR